MSTNALGSNYGEKVIKSIAKGFEASAVSIKTVNTTNIKDEHDSETGDTIYRKRKTQYKPTETSTGDFSGGTNNDILVGKIPYTRQNVITVFVDWNTVEEKLELNQLDELLMPIGESIVARAETNLNQFMLANSALTVGTPGTAVTTWEHVASAEALLFDIGCGAGTLNYQMGSSTSTKLSGIQTGLNNDGLVSTAWRNAQVSSPLAAMRTIRSNSINTLTNGVCATRAGALNGAPDVTYATAKDTMQQTLTVDGFSANGVIKAGETIVLTGKYHVNPQNGQTIFDAAQAPMEFRWTVVSDVTLDGSGAGSVVVTNAAIFDAASNNQYDNISAAPADNDVITILGASGALVRPNLFYHQDAFSFASIELPKLDEQDVTYQTKDGLRFRVSRGSDLAANKNRMRVDFVPAFGVSNSLHAGKGYGY